jgi:proline iminopeptidase
VIVHPAGVHVAVTDTRLWVEREGTGAPVLLLAGGPASSHLTFHPAFSALSDSFDVIYVDYRGRGRSDPVDDYRTVTFLQDVADIEALREALELERFHIYGFSYGGMVAQAYALAHPHRVSSLVLANTVHSPEMWQKNHENINREIANQFPEVWDEIMRLRSAGVRSTAPGMQQLYRVHAALVRFYNPDNAAKLLAEPGSRNDELYAVFAGDDIEFAIGGEVARLPDFRPRVHELRMPLLVIAGRYDRALYPAYQREFARYAPQAEFLMMERSGSFAHIEEPEVLMGLLRRFLSPSRSAASTDPPVDQRPLAAVHQH